MGFFSFGSTPKNNLPWEQLTSEIVLDELLNKKGQPILLFKHSTRCSISSMALSRFESEWKLSEEKCHLVFLDLINYRGVSNAIAERTGIVHQSPQVLLIVDGKVIYHNSHNGISAATIQKLIENQ